VERPGKDAFRKERALALAVAGAAFETNKIAMQILTAAMKMPLAPIVFARVVLSLPSKRGVNATASSAVIVNVCVIQTFHCVLVPISELCENYLHKVNIVFDDTTLAFCVSQYLLTPTPFTNFKYSLVTSKIPSE